MHPIFYTVTMESKARDIMSHEILTVTAETSVEDAIRLFVNNRVTGVPVVESTGKTVGVLSEFDIIKQISGTEKISGDVFLQKIQFSANVISVAENASLKEVLDLFVNTKVRRLPVLDANQKVVGIITRRDIMKILYYRAKYC